MSYVSRTLGVGETIEYEVEFHWLWAFSAYFFLIFGGHHFNLLPQVVAVRVIVSI